MAFLYPTMVFRVPLDVNPAALHSVPAMSASLRASLTAAVRCFSCGAEPVGGLSARWIATRMGCSGSAICFGVHATRTREKGVHFLMMSSKSGTSRFAGDRIQIYECYWAISRAT